MMVGMWSQLNLRMQHYKTIKFVNSFHVLSQTPPPLHSPPPPLTPLSRGFCRNRKYRKIATPPHLLSKVLKHEKITHYSPSSAYNHRKCMIRKHEDFLMVSHMDQNPPNGSRSNCSNTDRDGNSGENDRVSIMNSRYTEKQQKHEQRRYGNYSKAHGDIYARAAYRLAGQGSVPVQKDH